LSEFICSDVFEVGGFEWKLEMYPYGDSQSDKTLSVFLCAVDRKQLPGWSQTAHYQIAVVNKDPSKTSTHTGYDIFRGKRDSAWGWSKLINLSKLHDVSQGWADDQGRITLQATVHVVTHEYMPVNRVYRKSLCGLYYERVLQSYFEPFLKDELQRLDKLCGNNVLHKGFSDFWTGLPDAKKRALLQITMDEVLLNVKARLFSRDQPATYLAADVIFKAAHDCSNGLQDSAKRSLVGCTGIAVVSGGEGTVLRIERLTPEASGGLSSLVSRHDSVDQLTAGTLKASSRVMLRTHKGVIRMSNSANFVDVFRAQVSDALDNVRALVKHLKPQSCDGACLEAMGRQMLSVFAMCGMYITNVHPAYHEKLALQLQEDLIREEEEKNQKAEAKKQKQAEKRKKQQEAKAAKKAAEEAAKKAAEEAEKKKKEEEQAKKKAQEDEKARKKAEARRKAQEEAEKQRKLELEAEERRKAEEAERRAEEEARQAAMVEEEQKEGGVEYAKKQQIAAIMRDTALNPVQRQLRVQAILAGKVDVSSAVPTQTVASGHSSNYQSVAPASKAENTTTFINPGPALTRPQAPAHAQAQTQAQARVPARAPAPAPAPAPAQPAPAPARSQPPALQQPQMQQPQSQKPQMHKPQMPLSMHSNASNGNGHPRSWQSQNNGVFSEEEVDVESFALNPLTSIEHVMAIATSLDQIPATSDPSSSFMPYSAFQGNMPFAGSNSSYGAVPFGGGLAAHSGTTGSRLFERWAQPSGMSNGGGLYQGGLLVSHNGSDSEENYTEASLASTASGARTPMNFEGDDGLPSSPEVLQSESMATSCALAALDPCQKAQRGPVIASQRLGKPLLRK